MFLSAPANPTKTKHVIYLLAALSLGVVLSFLVHAGIETAYLSWAGSAGKTVTWYGGCALHPVIQVGLVIVGAVSGFFLGRFWWRLVYIERRWAKGKITH
ncbi:MAG: hypothetical protein WCV85_01715 [Patescibacteria group bacterium]|jgi:hypothetical protein